MDAPTSTKPLDQAIPAAGDRAGAARGALPNLVVIGAQKCGTSGLHYQLGLHPEIWMSRPKELNFFIEERSWSRGEDWYRAYFDARARVRGESSPNYTAYPQHLGVPERMRSVIPDAKLIYVVRDPLERIAAHWVHNYAKRREKGDLRATLTHANTSYVVRSQYHMQLQQFLAHYPLEQTLVIEQEELRTAPEATLRRVFEFVGVDPGFSHPHVGKQRHRDLAQDARQPSRRAARTAERHARGPRPAEERLAGDRREAGAGAVRSSGRTSASPSGPTCCRSCARTPSGSAS